MPLSFARKVSVVTDYLRRVGALDLDGAGQLLADDAVMVVPFAPSMADVPPFVGRDAILDQMRAVMLPAFERMDFTVDQWYDVADPAVLIAEYRSVCPLKRGGGEYRNSYVGIFHFAGVKIVSHKEYFNPAGLAAIALSGENDGSVPA